MELLAGDGAADRARGQRRRAVRHGGRPVARDRWSVDHHRRRHGGRRRAPPSTGPCSRIGSPKRSGPQGACASSPTSCTCSAGSTTRPCTCPTGAWCASCPTICRCRARTTPTSPAPTAGSPGSRRARPWRSRGAARSSPSRRLRQASRFGCGRAGAAAAPTRTRRWARATAGRCGYFPLLLEVLATNDHTFRAPVRPVLELLADSGFAFDHGQVGVAGADFVEEGGAPARTSPSSSATSSTCRTAASDRVRARTRPRSTPTPRVRRRKPHRELAATLGHGDAAPTLLAYAARSSDDEGPVVLANFAEPFAKLNGRARAGGILMSLVVEARRRDRHGRGPRRGGRARRCVVRRGDRAPRRPRGRDRRPRGGDPVAPAARLRGRSRSRVPALVAAAPAGPPWAATSRAPAGRAGSTRSAA